MKLESKALIVSLLCSLIVFSGMYLYRWSEMSNESILNGEQFVETNRKKMRRLRQGLDEYARIEQQLRNDALLAKEYYEKDVSFYAEFDEKGVEKIEDVLNTTYREEGFFQLKRLTLKHQASKNENTPSTMVLIIEGDKRLEKQ